MTFNRHRRYSKEHSPFGVIQAFIPKGTIEILRQKSLEMGLPISRLVSIAVDNELGTTQPFNYPTALPTTPFIEYAYIEEAQKIARYLLKFPTGVSRDQLMLCRRDIGIPDGGDFMHAYRELLHAKIIKETRPSKRAKFKYPEGYTVTKLVSKPAEKKEEEQTEDEIT